MCIIEKDIVTPLDFLVLVRYFFISSVRVKFVLTPKFKSYK